MPSRSAESPGRRPLWSTGRAPAEGARRSVGGVACDDEHATNVPRLEEPLWSESPGSTCVGRTGARMHETLHALRSRGWNVALDTPRELFTSAQRRRYPSAPPLFRAFLGSILDCSSPAKQCCRLYGVFGSSRARAHVGSAGTSASGWADGFAGDEAGAAEVRAFWDHHIPFMMAVHSDYDYLALRLDFETPLSSTAVAVRGGLRSQHDVRGVPHRPS